MGEALTAVKREFGHQAVILHTRTIPNRGILAGKKTQRVEITASRSGLDLPNRPRRGRVADQQQVARAANGGADMLSTVRETPRSANIEALSGELNALREELSELVADSRAARNRSLPGHLRSAYQKLIEAHVTEKLAARLVRNLRAELSDHQLQDPAHIRKCLSRHIRSMLPTAEPPPLTANLKPTVIAFVGPTGVGKTTTVAKLAAIHRLRENRSVGLITIDTYRIGAVDQLQTYARIIDLPLEVVATPAEMGAALHRLRENDVILIDTAGRSQNDQDRLQELNNLLRHAKPHEIHLVLAATGNSSVLTRIIQRFSHLGVNRLIFTKLDEAVGFGVMLNCLHRAEAHLSYVTTGQNVPNDIEIGRNAGLADLIVDGRCTLKTEELRVACVSGD